MVPALMLLYLRSLHVVANLVWVGSALSLSLLLARGPGDASQRGEAGRLLFRALANPASLVSLVLGLAMLGLEPTLYFKASHYMHAKLPLALAALGLTHALGARARRMAEGIVQDAGPAGALGGALGALSLAAALLALLKPF
jgi:protoporphyrinogen IX oxidase